MRSYEVLLCELIDFVKNKNIPGVIQMIQRCLEPAQQKNELQKALICFNFNTAKSSLNTAKSSYCSILHYAIGIKSNLLKQILIDNDLISKSIINRKTGGGLSLLAEAIENKDYEGIAFALQHHADPNEIIDHLIFRGLKNKSLLTLTAAYHDLQALKLLIDYKADVLRFGAESILYAITSFKHKRMKNEITNVAIVLQVMNLLIDSGANIMRLNEKKQTIVEQARDILFNKFYYSRNIRNEKKRLIQDEMNQILELLTNEFNNKKKLNYNMRWFFWTTKNDPQSTMHGLPTELSQKIANFVLKRN